MRGQVRLGAAGLAVLLLAVPSAAQLDRLKPPDVKYVPSPDSVVEAMLKLAKVTAADVVYDLGLGRWPDPDHRREGLWGARRRD